MSFVNTGHPDTTTGECVACAAQYFTQSSLVEDFTAVTHALVSALQVCDIAEIKKCVRENHQLLQRIGVVPHKVQEFIKELERRGMAAKICGAGACRGNSAGVVLIVGEENIDDCLADYGYSYLSLKGENNGVKVLL
jgi:mevalonate kinase